MSFIDKKLNQINLTAEGMHFLWCSDKPKEIIKSESSFKMY